MSLFLAMLGEAWNALTGNKMRTFLTAFGITIGVGAVVLMVALGQGTQRQVTDSISSLGSNLLVVQSGSSRQGGFRGGAGALPSLTLADMQAIGHLTPVGHVTAMTQQSAQLVYGPNNWSTMAVGTTPDYHVVRNWPVAAGRGLTDADLNGALRVTVIGQQVAKNLFAEDDPLGKYIRIKQSPFMVVGVLAAKGQSMDGRNQDDTLLVPLTTAQRQLFGSQFQGTVGLIMAQAVDETQMDAALAQISDLLRQRHRLREAADDDFSVTNMTSVANTVSQVTGMLSILLGAIASISLFVGGVGVMNIMLVSVTERTREIGIRMAIGASRRTILLQFMFEAVIITLAGGLVGVVLGVGSASLLARFAGLSVNITVEPILLSFGVSAAVGLFFGLYPARKASLLKPIEALRFS
jgi:putative ABC transport system permease protein